MLTLGVGFRLWTMRSDLALALSTELTPILDDDLPDEMRLALAVGVNF